MKAITVRILFATDTKPTRYKAQAEGVPAIIRQAYGTTPESVALELCALYDWGTRLASGVLPDGRTHAFCFIPDALLKK